jgi:hypothetical protein
MNLLFWRKNNQPNNPNYAPYEEIDSKKTSKLGYFFLVLMVIFGVWQGNNFLWALQDSINRPQPNSACLDVLENYTKNTPRYDDYYYNSYYRENNNCLFSAREIKLSLDVAYKNAEPTLASIAKADESISKINSELSSVQYNRNQMVTDYQLSLLESISGTDSAVFNQDYLQAGMVTQDEYKRRLETALTKATNDRTSLVSTAERLIKPYSQTINTAREQYRHDMVVYQFIQFIISLICIAPLFAYTWSRYHRSKNLRSEFAIIWGGIVATIAILLAQIILVFIYQILPHQIIQQIFSFLANFEFIWVLLYWLGFILVPLFFGFLIYIIQKKFYNKQAVMMRALKNMHCPGCSLKIHHGMNNCPVCGYKLKNYCQSCGAMTMAGGTFCEVCGAKNSEPTQNN